MKIELEEYPGEFKKIQIGDIYISGIMRDGKTHLLITALNNDHFIQIQPSTGNSVNLITGKDLRL